MALLIAAVVLTGIVSRKSRRDCLAAGNGEATPTDTDFSPIRMCNSEDNDFEKWCECIKKPCDWFCWGAEYQYRAVYQNSIKTLNNDAPGREEVYDRNIAQNLVNHISDRGYRYQCQIYVGMVRFLGTRKR